MFNISKIVNPVALFGPEVEGDTFFETSVNINLTFQNKRIWRNSRYGTLKLRVFTPRPQEPTWNKAFAGEEAGNLCKLIYLPYPIFLFTELLFL
jgi:hypothetical protein